MDDHFTAMLHAEEKQTMSYALTERSAARGPASLLPVLTLPLSPLVVWAVNTGGEALRWLALGGLASSMSLTLLISLEAGLFSMMLFEPLRGFLRRAQYLFVTYSQAEPIHLVTPLVTMLAVVMPLPTELTTPPVTKMNFGMASHWDRFVTSLYGRPAKPVNEHLC